MERLPAVRRTRHDRHLRPTGFGAVDGELELKTAPRLGREQVTLGRLASFNCDAPSKPLTLALTSEAPTRLEQDGRISVEVTVLARGGGHFDGDVVALVLELRSS